MTAGTATIASTSRTQLTPSMQCTCSPRLIDPCLSLSYGRLAATAPRQRWLLPEHLLRRLCSPRTRSIGGAAALRSGRLSAQPVEGYFNIVSQPGRQLSNSFLLAGQGCCDPCPPRREPSPAVKTKVVEADCAQASRGDSALTTHRSIRRTMRYRRCPFPLSDSLAGVSQWIRRCEWKTGGFSQTPVNTPEHLDEIHRGLSIMRAVNERPRYPEQTARFISQLQNANGGFRRAADSGISSLENAYYALKALVELSYWKG